MAKTNNKWIDFGTTGDQVNSQNLPANFTPSEYTPAQVGSEGTDKVSAHLKGIDNKLATVAALPDGDINPSTFSGANNQVSPANVTGLTFSTKNHFKARINVRVDATADLFESYEILGTKKTADWDISQVSSGDDSLVTFSITSGGQIQYTSGNYAGFASLTIDFRAEAL